MKPKMTVLGRLGREWVARETKSGAVAYSNSVACSYKIKSEERTDWVRVTAWNKLGALIAQYSVKGDMIFLEGHATASCFEMKDGTSRANLDLMVDQFAFVGSNKSHDKIQDVSHETASDANEDLPY